jgi:hypothetical protein
MGESVICLSGTSAACELIVKDADGTRQSILPVTLRERLAKVDNPANAF